MATISKRVGKRGTRWLALVRRGAYRATKTFDTKREAEAWSRSVEGAIDRDEYTATPDSKKRTVSEMLERYRRSELPKKADRRNADRHIKFWTAEIGEIKIGAVTRAQIVEIRDRMVETRTPATVNRYIATLRHAFRIASLDWDWVARNPCEKMALREPRGRDRHLSDDEIKRLLKATAQSEHPHLHPVVLIALTTGARRGEVMSLRWADIDLSKGRAVLHKTKNTDKRALSIAPKVVAALRELRKVRRIDDDRVFAPVNDEGKRTYTRLEDAWQTALGDADVKDFRFHDLRHTFASRMAMSGATLAEIAAALGHRTLAMVQRYAHLTEAHVHSVAEKAATKVLDL